jgi:hypothetical protein
MRDLTVVTEREGRLVVSSMHDRDHAEAQLAYRESRRQKEEHQRWQWQPVLYEDFEKGVLPNEISVLSGSWSVNHGQLLAAGDVRSRPMTRSTRGDIRVRLDVVAYRPMQLYLALPSTAVNGTLDDSETISVACERQCHIYRGRRELGAREMPEIVSGVSQRLAIQRDGAFGSRPGQWTTADLGRCRRSCRTGRCPSHHFRRPRNGIGGSAYRA